MYLRNKTADELMKKTKNLKRINEKNKNPGP